MSSPSPRRRSPRHASRHFRRVLFLTCGLAGLAGCGLAGLAGLAGCEGLIGADFDRELDPDASNEDGGEVVDIDSASTADGGALGADAKKDGLSDASIANVECGDMSGLSAGAPWPTGGACNTRVGRVAAPPLVNPKIAWRYYLGVGTTALFMTPPIIAANGTIYAVAFDPPDGGATLAYSLVAVKSGGQELFRAPLSRGTGSPTLSSPTIAKDGTVYVSSMGYLSAFNGVTGERKWEESIGGAEGSSPTVLSDGTIVVAGNPDLYAFNADRTIKWQKPPAGYSFRGTVAVLPSGVLVVDEQPAIGTLDGALQLFAPNGVPGKRLPLALTPITSPFVDEASRFGVRTTSTHHVFTSMGDIDTTKAGPGLNEAHAFVALAPPIAWYSARKSSPIALDLTSGAVIAHPELGSFTTAFAASGDGSIVFAHRVDGKNELVGMSPQNTKWQVPLELTGADPTGPAIGADGTVYLTWGAVLYAVKD